MRHEDEPITEPITPANLSEEDICAIDALFEHGFSKTGSSDNGSNKSVGSREKQLNALLGLLGTPVADESHRASRIDLVEVIARRVEHNLGTDDLLSPSDEDAVEAYIESGYSLSGVEPELRDRAARLDQINALLTTGRNADSLEREDLVISTLGGIQAHIDAERLAMNIAQARGFQLPARWADLVSIAAMLLLAASVILPIMSGLRSSSQRELCFSNMNGTGNAFGLYTGANRDMLPMATAGFGPTWLDVGSTPERSNSSNLYTLVRNGFSGLDELACPSNPNAPTGEPEPDAWDWNSLKEISYSYRIMPRGGMRATAVDQPVRVVLLADRSPVVLRMARKQPIIPEENSPNHSGSGQHMLMLDGSARWETTPVLDNRDNIWLPRPVETVIHNERARLGIMTGNEQPAGPSDAFVGP